MHRIDGSIPSAPTRAGQQAIRAEGAERRATELRGQLDRSEASVSQLQRRIDDLADAMSLIGNPNASTSYLDQAVTDCRTALDDSQTLQDLIESMPQPPGS